MKNKKEFIDWLYEYFNGNEDMVVTNYDNEELYIDFKEWIGDK